MNFEIETADHPNKLELKNGPFYPPFCRRSFFSCFGIPDPNPSRFKQEKKAMYTVYKEKHNAHLASSVFFSFLNYIFFFQSISF